MDPRNYGRFVRLTDPPVQRARRRGGGRARRASRRGTLPRRSLRWRLRPALSSQATTRSSWAPGLSRSSVDLRQRPRVSRDRGPRPRGAWTGTQGSASCTGGRRRSRPRTDP